MVLKKEIVTQLYEDISKRVTSSLGNWTNFLEVVMILYYVGGLLGLVSILFLLLFMLSILTGDSMSGWLPILIFAYVFSPFGSPVLAALIVAHIELLRDWTMLPCLLRLSGI